MPIRFGRVVVGCVWLILPASSAWASPEPDAGDATPPSFTTTVRARPERPTASQQVVDGEVVQATAKVDAGEALRLVPGLVVSRHGGEGKAHQLFLRGFDALHGQDLELVVGGVPVNAVSHVHALGYADLGFVVPEVIGSLEAFEGPYRVDQGDFAVAGTVRLSLEAPGPGVFGALSLGQYGRRRVMAGLAADDPRTFAVFDLAEGKGAGAARGFSRATLLAQGRRRIADLELRALAGAHTTRFKSPGVISARDHDAGAIGFFDTYDPHQGGSSDRLHLMLEAATPADDTAASVYVVRQNTRLQHNFTGFWFDPRGDGLVQFDDATTVGLTLRTSGRARLLRRPLRWDAGGGLRHDLLDQSQQGYRASDGSLLPDSARAFDLSIAQSHLFAYTRARLRQDRWQLALGVRADAFSARVRPLGEAQRHALGARAGVEASVGREMGEHSLLVLQYGDGFRSPHAASLADGERTPFISVRGAEVGWRTETRTWSTSLALFGSWVGNDLFFDHTVSTTVPLGPTMRGGLAGTLALAPIEGLRLLGSGTVAHAVALDTGTALPGFMPFVGRFDAAWRKDLRAFTLEASAALTAVGPRPLRFGDVGDGYLLTDLRLTVGWRRVGLRLDVSNLLDARWTDGEFTYPSRFHDDPTASSLPLRHLTAGAPRTATVSVVLHPWSTP